MEYTISTHNGSKVARSHNIRDRRVTDKEEHIDPTKPHEIWHDETERSAYHRLFDKALADYNARQTQPDRRIRDYYSKVDKDAKKHTAYEMIISVGSRDIHPPADIGYKIMREFVDGWSDRNPNMELIGAYYHADEEGVPHVHIDYIPVAHGYKRGMKTQTALRSALEEQGFIKHGKATPQIQWQARENQHLEKICNSYGLEIIHPDAGKGKKHAETLAFKIQREAEGYADAIKQAAEKQAGSIIQKANDKAAAAIREAEDKAAKIVADARAAADTEADGIIRKANEQAAAAIREANIKAENTVRDAVAAAQEESQKTVDVKGATTMYKLNENKESLCPADELVDIDLEGYEAGDEEESCITETFDLDGKRVE